MCARGRKWKALLLFPFQGSEIELMTASPVDRVSSKLLKPNIINSKARTGNGVQHHEKAAAGLAASQRPPRQFFTQQIVLPGIYLSISRFYYAIL